MKMNFFKKTSMALAAVFVCLSVLAPAAGAVDVLQPCQDPAAKDSTLCKAKSASDGKNPIYGPDGIITKAISFLSIIVAIAATITIIVAGLKYVTSGSNPQDVTKARELVLYAVVGLIVAGSAQAIVRFFLNTIK